MDYCDELLAIIVKLDIVIHEIEKSKADSKIRMAKIEEQLRITNDILNEIKHNGETDEKDD